MGFFINRGDGFRNISASNADVIIADLDDLDGQSFSGTVYAFDPSLGKTYQLSGTLSVDGGGVPTAGATEVDVNTLVDGTSAGTLLIWDGSSDWVEETDLVFSSNVLTVGTAASTTGSLALANSAGGTGTLSFDGTNITSNSPVDVTGGVTASGSLDINGATSAISGALTIGDATNVGSITISDGTNSVRLSENGNDTLVIGDGTDDGIIENLADVTGGNSDYAANKGYVDSQIAAVSSGQNWKGQAVAIVTSLDITDGTNTHTLADEDDLATALSGTPGSLSASAQWYFSDDEGTINLDMNLNSHTVTEGQQVSDGDYIVYKNGASSVVYKVVGTVFELQNGLDGQDDFTPAQGDHWGVTFDLTDSPNAKENQAIFAYNGSDFVKTADVDFGPIEDGTTDRTLTYWNNTTKKWVEDTEIVSFDVSGNVGFRFTGSATAIVLSNGTGASATNLIINSSERAIILYKGAQDANNAKLGFEASGTLHARTEAVDSANSPDISVITGGTTTSGDSGSVTIETGTAAGTRGTITLNADADDTVLTNSPTTDTIADSNAQKSVADVQFIRDNIIRRNVDATVANAGNLTLTSNAQAAKFIISVKGNTTQADAYASEIMAVRDGASTVDANEYAIVGDPAAASITVSLDGSDNVQVQVGNTTGEEATVVIECIPLV